MAVPDVERKGPGLTLKKDGDASVAAQPRLNLFIRAISATSWFFQGLMNAGIYVFLYVLSFIFFPVRLSSTVRSFIDGFWQRAWSVEEPSQSSKQEDVLPTPAPSPGRENLPGAEHLQASGREAGDIIAATQAFVANGLFLDQHISNGSDAGRIKGESRDIIHEQQASSEESSALPAGSPHPNDQEKLTASARVSVSPVSDQKDPVVPQDSFLSVLLNALKPGAEKNPVVELPQRQMVPREQQVLSSEKGDQEDAGLPEIKDQAQKIDVQADVAIIDGDPLDVAERKQKEDSKAAKKAAKREYDEIYKKILDKIRDYDQGVTSDWQKSEEKDFFKNNMEVFQTPVTNIEVFIKEIEAHPSLRNEDKFQFKMMLAQVQTKAKKLLGQKELYDKGEFSWENVLEKMKQAGIHKEVSDIVSKNENGLSIEALKEDKATIEALIQKIDEGNIIESTQKTDCLGTLIRKQKEIEVLINMEPSEKRAEELQALLQVIENIANKEKDLVRIEDAEERKTRVEEHVGPRNEMIAHSQSKYSEIHRKMIESRDHQGMPISKREKDALLAVSRTLESLPHVKTVENFEQDRVLLLLAEANKYSQKQEEILRKEEKLSNRLVERCDYHKELCEKIDELRSQIDLLKEKKLLAVEITEEWKKLENARTACLQKLNEEYFSGVKKLQTKIKALVENDKLKDLREEAVEELGEEVQKVYEAHEYLKTLPYHKQRGEPKLIANEWEKVCNMSKDFIKLEREAVGIAVVVNGIKRVRKDKKAENPASKSMGGDASACALELQVVPAIENAGIGAGKFSQLPMSFQGSQRRALDDVALLAPAVSPQQSQSSVMPFPAQEV